MTKKQQPHKVLLNNLYLEANELRKSITDETELENRDMTQAFYRELELMIKEGEIIIININAKMRLGKSTCAMSIAKHIHHLLQKYGQQPIEKQFGIKNIARDHQEHTKIMKDPNTMYTVIVTDEENALENTGENVTTEQALSKVFSDVQAGRYVHRVCCSPKETTDPNADIMLSVIAPDKHQKITHAKLYYRFYEGRQEYTQLLGYVRIPVGHIIKTWDTVKKHFLKPKPTEEDKQIIQKASKKDWYTLYMVKKYEKMELITREGIFRPRVLEYAQVIRETVEELKPLTQMERILTLAITKNFIKQKFREHKIPTSIIGEELATKEATGILDLYKSLHKIKKEIIKVKDPQQRKLLKETLKKLASAINLQEAEMKRYQLIQQKYNQI